MRIRLPFAGRKSLRLPPSTFLLPPRRTLAAQFPSSSPTNNTYSLPRPPRTGVFFFLLLLAGYAGLTAIHLDLYVNDKFLHLLTFFLLTVIFYWILDTNRRRTLHFTLVVCTLCLGVGSEFLQAFLPNGRDFDFYDIVANVVGSLGALALCSWYHKCMLERKRQRKTYTAVPGDDDDEEEGAGAVEDIELGGGVVGAQESGVVVSSGEGGPAAGAATTVAHKGLTLEEEVDNWDENAPDDWDAAVPEDANGEDLKKQRAD